MSSRVKVISVLRPAGPANESDRVFALATAGVDYEEALIEWGQWENSAEAEAEAERINGLTDAEFSALSADIANR